MTTAPYVHAHFCPACGGYHSIGSRQHEPPTGEVSICWSCGAVCFTGDDGTMRELSDADLAGLTFWQQQFVEAARETVKQRNAELRARGPRI